MCRLRLWYDARTGRHARTAPAPNIKVERIASLTANLQMALEARSLRVLAPIPGKNAVGIELPNRRASPVTFREIVEGEAWRNNTCEIPLALGKDVAGNDLIYDLAKAPHLLVAGATGSGKSVCLNSILNGFLMSRTPEQLRLILVDPKRVEFTCYNDLPHLLVPVINDPKKVAFGLRWAITEMDKRYRLFQKVNCRNIVAFNNRQVVKQEDLFDDGSAADAGEEDTPKRLPYIVIVVDEVADIMAAVGRRSSRLSAVSPRLACGWHSSDSGDAAAIGGCYHRHHQSHIPDVSLSRSRNPMTAGRSSIAPAPRS